MKRIMRKTIPLILTTGRYREYCKLEGIPFDMERSKLCDRIQKLYGAFLKELLFEGYKVPLPYHTGTLIIQGSERDLFLVRENAAAINWRATLELWRKDPEMKEKKVYMRHDNSHTNGVIYSVRWHKSYSYFPYKFMYRFKLGKVNRKELANRIFAGKRFEIVSPMTEHKKSTIHRDREHLLMLKKKRAERCSQG